MKFCSEDLSMGGRGIGNKLEVVFVNPLSRTIFEQKANAEDKIEIIDILYKGNSWSLISKKL